MKSLRQEIGLEMGGGRGNEGPGEVQTQVVFGAWVVAMWEQRCCAPHGRRGCEAAFTHPPSPALHTKWGSDEASRKGW